MTSTPALLFFVPSLPDETLQSRVVRHHVLSGNRIEAETFLDLFDSIPFALEQIASPPMLHLADRMGDGSPAARQKLLEQNTLWPLFEPFLADGPQPITTDIGTLVSRLPRRVVGHHGEARLCPACVREDVNAYGMGYWHRAHHVPGVGVCWRHGGCLLSSCPQCRRPFQFRARLLRQPWHACHCGWDVAGAEDTSASDVRGMLDYARFAHDLLNYPLGQVSRLRLRVVYQNRMRELGFGWGSQIQAKAFQEHLIGELGDAFLSAVDPAFASKRMSFWIRLTGGNNSTWDMPITRHLLLAKYLFDTRDRFALALQRVSDEDAVRGTRAAESQSGRSVVSPPSTPRAAHRGRIREELSRNPKTTLEDLWRRANRITSWLYEHDRKWLVETLSAPATDGARRSSSAETASPDDERFAAHVDTAATELLTRSGKPQQVTKERLLAALPVSVADTPRHRERYPRTLKRVTDNRESTWHFRARRLWWAYAVLSARGDAPPMFEAVVLSGVGLYAAQAIIEYCGWENLLPLAANIDVLEKLSGAGISIKWEGPPAWRGQAIGGRAYQRRK
ncbi:TnsD family Tn7-like transposition protein [Paraburkholderia tropica]|uniref:TniQ protein n=1 Tax=Paraburkholderia tropica TaxID=92647 RepID=A0AAQ1GMM5_9BURK|nr:TnsD family Tn7-like transposition protein [Paraburkholderia tropica]RQN37192.1 transposase [Paraburkholderia tropica]SEK13247.1 TniQ protein [Paraburkholderia tropica]